MSNVSANYRELYTSAQILQVASETEKAWQNPSIPGRQYDLVQTELQTFRINRNTEPFAAFNRCLQQLPENYMMSRDIRLLDVGAASGYYSEVLKLCGFRGQYNGFDFSDTFAKFAGAVYPGINYDIGDARQLPYHDDSFDIVVSGAMLMHIYEWHKALAELVRCSSRYIILHRTPIAKATTYWEKEAYGVKCLEIHFSENDLYWQCKKLGVGTIFKTDVFWHYTLEHGHRSYLLEKPAGLKHQPV